MSPQPGLPEQMLLLIASLLANMLRTLPIHPDATAEEVAALRTGAAYAVSRMEPRDPIQAMLACRTMTLYYAIDECLRRASLPDIPHNMATRYQSNAARLSRQMEAAQRELSALQAAAREEAALQQKAAATPQAASPPAQPQPQPQPAAAAQKGRQDPMPSETPARTNHSVIQLPGPPATTMDERVMEDMMGRPGAGAIAAKPLLS